MASFRADRSLLHGFGWSTAFLIVTRLSALAAVPIVLHGLTPDLYAVWVLAGAVVMIQSLFDLGVASAVVRFVALAAAGVEGGRSAVIDIARRATMFYLLLSAAVFLPLWFEAREIVGLVHFLKHAEVAPAVVIVRWAAVAFVLTNVALVAASVLQGIDRVAASYRDQTLGWLLYLPLLGVGLSVGPKAQAVGVAWVGAYAVQTLLLSRSLVAGIRAVPDGYARVPSLLEMLSFGGRWQVSAWADFATFQLPRFLAGAALSSGDVISLDVAIRAGQFAVAPVFAFYPTVLPRAAALLTQGGLPALRTFLQRYYRMVLPLLVMSVCVFIPIEVPALAVWTGRPASMFNPLVVASVLIGTAAHASTGLLTSAQLARGDVSSVIRYKTRQLLLAVALLALAAPAGLVPVALALCLALSAPAVQFNIRSGRELDIRGVFGSTRARWRLPPFLLAQVAAPLAVVMALRPMLTSLELLAVGAFAVLACLALEGLLVFGAAQRRYSRPLWVRTGSPPPAADHLARK